MYAQNSSHNKHTLIKCTMKSLIHSQTSTMLKTEYSWERYQNDVAHLTKEINLSLAISGDLAKLRLASLVK